MTSEQFYEKNKKTYNDEAFFFIHKNLKNKGDMCHRPFEMMTYYTRTICEKISDDAYLVFKGYVKSTKYYRHREIKEYTGKKDGISIYTKHELIRMFGFEISLNPNSKSNKLIRLYLLMTVKACFAITI